MYQIFGGNLKSVFSSCEEKQGKKSVTQNLLAREK